jgi:hypothetical protein
LNQRTLRRNQSVSERAPFAAFLKASAARQATVCYWWSLICAGPMAILASIDSAAIAAMLYLRQGAMHKVNRDRTFANG